MDEISEKALETSVSLVIQPLVGVVQDAVGVGGGDWLSEVRKRNRAKLEENTRRICEEQRLERLEPPNPVTVAPIITAAQDETREDLQDLWARLLAAALDPARSQRYRREFVDAVKMLEPNDVVVLLSMEERQMPRPEGWFSARVIAEHCHMTQDQVVIAFRNLIRSACCEAGSGVAGIAFPIEGIFLSPLGRELLEVVLQGHRDRPLTRGS